MHKIHKPHLLMSDDLYQYMLSISLHESPIQNQLRLQTIEKVAESEMMIAPEQAQFISLLVNLIGARRAIEVGVYTGYGSLAIATALPPDGELIACDISEEWPAFGKPYWEKAGVSHKIHLKIAPALETLQNLLTEGQKESFDFIFIDADKLNYPNYYELSLQLLRKGGIIVLDNVLMTASNLVYEQKTPSMKVLHQLNMALLNDKRVALSTISIGEGMTILRKL